MKILCIIDSLGSGGAQRQLVNLAMGFKERGHDVYFLVYHRENFFKETLDQNNIPVHEVLENNYLFRFIKMRSFIRRGNFDAVLSFLEAANFISEISGLPYRNWKLIVGERSANPYILKSLRLRLYRWFHLFADYVVTNSQENMRLVRLINPLLSKAKCKVIYNAVDLEIWRPNLKYTPRADGKLKITIVASHQYLKNLNGLIEAVNLLTGKEKKSLKIEWYGDQIKHPYIDNSFPEGVLKIQKYRLENIFEFFPANQNIIPIIQSSDAIGLFSKYEGLPNSICEAMGCAKTVICTFVSDNNLFISQHELLCEPNNTKSIANSLRYLLNLSTNELERIGNLNREKAKIYFEKNQIIDNYLRILEK